MKARIILLHFIYSITNKITKLPFSLKKRIQKFIFIRFYYYYNFSMHLCRYIIKSNDKLPSVTCHSNKDQTSSFVLIVSDVCTK